MENAEEIFRFLEDFSKRKTKTIPQELNEYLAYVARTGDPVYQWSLVKSLFKEKLLNVITDFYDTTPGLDIPPYPNVDPFNYDTMKNSLLERLDSFTSAPFTVQRICELLTCPRKQYNRVDKFMRAIEKNILVVSTREPGPQRYPEPENGEPNEPIVNGSDNNSEYNVDVEMEDMSWKENAEQQNSEPQPGSSDAHISVDDIEARLKAKQDVSKSTQDKITTHYESVTPPELNVTTDEEAEKSSSECGSEAIPSTSSVDEGNKIKTPPPESNHSNNELSLKEESTGNVEEPKEDVDMIPETTTQTFIIPEIKVYDADMTEEKIKKQSSTEEKFESTETIDKEETNMESTSEVTTSTITASIALDESSSDSNSKEELENKIVTEVLTSSEESSSSSDNTEGNSNSPKLAELPEQNLDVQEDVSQPEVKLEEKQEEDPEERVPEIKIEKSITNMEIETYSISDVNSELPQPPPEVPKKEVLEEKKEDSEIEKVESNEPNTENKDS